MRGISEALAGWESEQPASALARRFRIATLAVVKLRPSSISVAVRI
jgi:hypothetical protein